MAGSGLDTLGGYNTDPNDGDEVNGGGTNWPVWPVLTNMFDDRHVLLLGENDYALFTDECPDVVVTLEDDTFQVKPVGDTVVISPQTSTYVVRPTPDNYGAQTTVRRVVVRRA